MMEKLAFALVTASRKLRHYFQAHVINVLTDHPLNKAMNKLEVARRLIQWAIELSEFNVRYQLRSVIKVQALADFIVEFTPNQGELDGWMELRCWSSMWMARPRCTQEGLKLYKNPQKETS